MSVARTTLTAALLCAVVGAPAYAAPKTRVLVLNLAASESSLQLLAASLTEQISTELSRTQHIEAMSQSDLAAVLGLEREKQLLGCAEDSTSCFAELSAALGAQLLVTGSLARLGGAVRIDLKLIRTKDGVALHRDGRSTNQEAEVFGLLATMVKELAGRVAGSGGVPTETATSSSSTSGAGPGPIVLMSAGAVALVAGIVVSGIAGSQWKNLNDPVWAARTSWVDVKATGDSFNTNAILGPLIIGTGLAAASVGLLWRLLARPEPAVTLVLTGNALVIGGAF